MHDTFPTQDALTAAKDRGDLLRQEVVHLRKVLDEVRLHVWKAQVSALVTQVSELNQAIELIEKEIGAEPHREKMLRLFPDLLPMPERRPDKAE